jgi:hypothetical protein
MAEATEQAPKDLIGFLDFYLVKKAPFQLPDGVREAIVRFGPWIAVVLLILMLPFILFALGVGTFFLPLAAMSSPYAGSAYLGLIFAVVQLVLLVMALPGLFARKMSGWRLALYARLVAIAGGIVSFAWVGALLGGLIGLYILMQVRGLYHD